MFGSKPLRARFDKVDGFIGVHDVICYLPLFDSKKYDAIYNIIRYLNSKKSSITYVFSHYYAKIKVYSHDSLPLENFDFT